MSATQEDVIREASFNPKVKTYWLLTGCLILTLTIIGIPLLVIWIPLGLAITGKYLKAMQAILTPKVLKVNKGVMNRIEKTIPLDKITDLALVQGPIMRALGLQGLRVETAGQSGPGALVALVGIEDTEDFREAVLAQRDRLQSGAGGTAPAAPAASAPAPSDSQTELLTQIRDTLQRMEKRLPPGGS